jgi:hypothetical protein
MYRCIRKKKFQHTVAVSSQLGTRQLMVICMFSSRPCPTYCIHRGVPIFISTVNFSIHNRLPRTLGRVTFGMTTTLRAEGASFLMLVSPPGWYW